MKLKDIKFGKNDGKKEAKLIPDFDRYFYDPEKLFDRMLEPARFLILGRKGSGKTLLAHYFAKKVVKEDSVNTCEILSLKNVKYAQMITVPEDVNNPNQYFNTWKWILLVTYGNLLLRNQSVADSDEYLLLSDFIVKELKLGQVTFEKLVEHTSTATFEVSVSFLKAGISDQKKKTAVSFEDLIEPLKQMVYGLANITSGHTSLIIDEIDDKFRIFTKDSNVLMGLIKAADEINTDLLDYNQSCKVYLLVRTDIFGKLNDSDLEKIRRDCSIKLDWESRFDYKAPVFLLAIHKMKESVPELKNRTPKNTYERCFFGDSDDKTDPAAYILNRTLIRPRDVITYFSLIAEDFPEEEKITIKQIHAVERKYSEYFLGEIRNELVAHFDNAYIEAMIALIKLTGREFIVTKDFENTLASNYGRVKIDNLQKCIDDMFEFGIIGYQYEDIMGNIYYRFLFRDVNAPLDPTKTFKLHPGLVKELIR